MDFLKNNHGESTACRCNKCNDFQTFYWKSHTHTHTQTCKHRQTGSSHCSSFVYTTPLICFVHVMVRALLVDVINVMISKHFTGNHTHTHTPSLVLHTLCGHSFVLVYLRNKTYLNHCYFHWRLFLGRISSQSFLLIVSSILRQIATYQNA